MSRFFRRFKQGSKDEPHEEDGKAAGKNRLSQSQESNEPPKDEAKGDKPNQLESQKSAEDQPFDEKPVGPRPPRMHPNPNELGKSPSGEEETGEDEEEESEDGSESDDDRPPTAEGAYDPGEYESLPVSGEIKELFSYITSYSPQVLELETKMKPFIPEYIAAVGDIDAFIKIPRPDEIDDNLGLVVLDEPAAQQSDPTVLSLKLRNMAKGTLPQGTVVKNVQRADRDPKEIDGWIRSIQDLHRSKPATNVHYNKTMPDIDTLMQEWPPDLEDLLKGVDLPGADIDTPLETYVDLICSLLDIPVYKSRVQSLHVLFSLYSEFKNSQHFKVLQGSNGLGVEEEDGGEVGQSGIESTDRLIL